MAKIPNRKSRIAPSNGRVGTRKKEVTKWEQCQVSHQIPTEDMALERS